MQKINFTFWRDAQEQHWSVEVNGNVYESVPAALVKQLVQHALIEADESTRVATIH